MCIRDRLETVSLNTLRWPVWSGIDPIVTRNCLSPQSSSITVYTHTHITAGIFEKRVERSVLRNTIAPVFSSLLLVSLPQIFLFIFSSYIPFTLFSLFFIFIFIFSLYVFLSSSSSPSYPLSSPYRFLLLSLYTILFSFLPFHPSLFSRHVQAGERLNRNADREHN